MRGGGCWHGKYKQGCQGISSNRSRMVETCVCGGELWDESGAGMAYSLLPASLSLVPALL